MAHSGFFFLQFNSINARILKWIHRIVDFIPWSAVTSIWIVALTYFSMEFVSVNSSYMREIVSENLNKNSLELPFKHGRSHFASHLVPVLSIVHPSRHEHLFGAVHAPLAQPLFQDKNKEQRKKAEKRRLNSVLFLGFPFKCAYFGQTGVHCAFCNRYPSPHSHFSGATQ